MAWDDIVERGRGFLEFGLLISGIGKIFHSGGDWDDPTTIAGITGDLEPMAFLNVENLEESLEIDPKEWDLKAANLTFELVDARADDGTQHALTPLFGRKIGGVNSTRLASTLTASGTVIEVDDASGFTAPFDAFRGQETIGVDTIDLGATPDELQDLTRGKYGSVAQEHVRALDPGRVRAEGEFRPLISDGPISLHGRYVFLYAREARPDGTFDPVKGLPTLRYIGRIMGSVECDGPVWRIPTESVWTAIDSMIPSRDRGAQLTEIAFGRDQVIEYTVNSSGFSDFVTLSSRRYTGPAALVAEFLNAINVSLIAAAEDFTIVAVPGAAPFGLGEWSWRLIDDLGAVERLDLRFATGELARALGFNDEIRGARVRGGETIYSVYTDDFGAGIDVITAPIQAGVMPSGDVGEVAVGVSDAIQFSAVELIKDDEGDDDPSYDVRTFVLFGATAYQLLDVDVGTNTLTVRPYSDFGELAAVSDPRDIQYAGEPPVEVRQFLRLSSDKWWAPWKALLESTTVSREFKGYTRGDLFDWDGIAAADSLVAQMPMRRWLFERVSLRDVLVEDMRIRGLLPTIRDGKVSCVPLQAPGELASTFVVDEDIVLAEELLLSTYSKERIINGLEYRWRWNWQTGVFEPPTVLQQDVDSQQDNEIVNIEPVENKGLNWQSVEDAEAIVATAKNFLSIFGQDYAVIEVPVTIGAGNIVPGDVIALTDESVPDPESGERGVTSFVCLVLGVKRKPYAAKGMLTVLAITDGRRRSGWAPAARIASYVDNGAPAGDARHELTLTTGLYAPATEAANTEGTYFNAGMKVELRQRDTTSATVESNTISPTGHNAAGTSVYLTAAPGAGMLVIIAAGRAYITLDDYTTASQTAEAKTYLHTCDEDDGLILDTDEGFSPA